MRMLLEELRLWQSAPTTLLMDNQSAIVLATNTETVEHAKYIDIRYHFIRDRIEKGEIEVTYYPSNENLSDILTKPLACLKFEKFCILLGMMPSRRSVKDKMMRNILSARGTHNG